MSTDLIDFPVRQKACRKLAALRGWHDIKPYGSSGHMVGVMGNNTGTMLLPLWTEETDAALGLATALGIDLDFSDKDAVTAKGAPGPMAYARHATNVAAIRYAIVVAAIHILEGKKKHEQAKTD